MAAQSTYLREKLLEHLGGSGYTAPATVYMGLFTTPVSSTGGGTEVSGGGYARKSMTFSAAASGSIATSAAVSWSPLHTGSTLTLFGWGIFDASTAGNLLFFGQFASPFTVPANKNLSWAAGEIELSVGANTYGGLTTYAANKWLDLVLRNQAWSAPTVYLGMLTDYTNETEVSGGGYARQAQTFTNSGETSEGSAESWSPLSTAAANDIEGHGWWDASTAGNLLAKRQAYDDATVAVSVPQNDDLSVADTILSWKGR